MQHEYKQPDATKLRVSRRAFLGPILAGLGGLAMVCLRGKQTPIQPDEDARLSHPITMEEYVQSLERVQSNQCIGDFPLATNFATPDGALHACIRLGSSPIVGGKNERLFLVQGGRHHLIERLDDLAGKVRIDSPEAALSFVRLYTSPRTYYMPSAQRMPALANLHISFVLEVIPHTRLNAGFFFGDTDMMAGIKRVLGMYNDFMGVVKSHVLPKDLPLARVTKARGGYLIRRPLVANPLYNKETEQEGPPRYFVVEEWVGPQGEFKLEKVTLLDERIAKQLSAFWFTGH